MTQRAHWCLTIVYDIVQSWTSTARAEWCEQAGNMETPMIIEYSGIGYSLWIGHMEGADDNTKEPHYHILISCPSGRTATKAKALNILNAKGFKVSGVGNVYCQELQTTPAKYKNYIFKTALKTNYGSVDGIISKAAERLKKTSNITKELLRKALIEEQGPTWYNKNKGVVDTYMSAIDNFQTQRIVDVEEDMDEIVARTRNILETYYEIILHNIEQNGYDTMHEFFQGVAPESMAKYITIISILPYLFQRNALRMDNIPGLYFYGEAGAGKSMIFTMGRSFKMIATDASGIAKFKLEGCQSAFLLDDIKADAINEQTFMATLRQLILGGYSRIKTHSDTQQVKGFVAVTSNEVPCYFNSPNSDEEKINYNAWRRRFISLEFKYRNLKDFDRQGNEFDYTQSLKEIAQWIKDAYDTLMTENDDNDGRYFKMINTLTPYYNSLYKYLTIPAVESVLKETLADPEVKYSTLSGEQLLEKEELERLYANNPELLDEAAAGPSKKRKLYEIFDNSPAKKVKPNLNGLVIDVTSDDSQGKEGDKPPLEDGELEPSQLEEGEWTQTQSKNYNEDAFAK